MELIILFCILPLLSIALFFIPKEKKGIYSLAIVLVGIIITVIMLLKAPSLSSGYREVYRIGFFNPIFYIDHLSVLFIALLNIVSLTAFWYSIGYLKTFEKTKSNTELSLHYAAYIWLYCSMLGVILFRDTLTFLFFWEMMTGATFILVIFEGENNKKLKTAINYLVQMHICLFILLIAFSIAERFTGLTGFDAVAEYFFHNKNHLLFILFFIGFGIKAGFFPLHTWLPQVHPAAPGNVSGFMSGAVIKMGIYGLLRVVGCLQTDLLFIGIFVVVVSAITGIYGISNSVKQKDIKKLLAYSSIENIGIIGLGIGLGILGTYWELPLLSFSGYAGALLHTFNHSMFKSMLFFSAGTLCKSTHTQEMDKMGGAIRKMPYTAAFFLIGAVAICALPPLNGFISEFIIYNGIFASLNSISNENAVVLILVVLSLVLIGGISIIAFTKAFGISFLGNSRSEKHIATKEPLALIIPLFLPLAFILFIGFFPFAFFKFISSITENVFGISHSYSIPVMSSLQYISLVTFLFVALCMIVLYCRNKMLSKKPVTTGPTWGCGYTAPNSKLQYTASSYSNNFEKLLNNSKGSIGIEPISDNNLFPATNAYKNEQDVSKNRLNRFLINVKDKLTRLAIFQTGKIQHYVLFALVFMGIILVLSYLNLI